MKNLKKTALAVFTVCFFVLCTMFCAANVSAAGVVDSGDCGDHLTWVLYDDGELVIDGTGDMWNYNHDEAPWYSYCSIITSVTISDSVASIGSYAFTDCIGITNITLPDSVTDIGDGAFYRCTGLTNVTIPNSVTSIGCSAFFSCTNLATITIPDRVTVIETDTFEHCINLISVTLPNSITEIGPLAFIDCPRLTSIIIPDSVSHISFGAFADCSSLTSVTLLSPDVKYSTDTIDVFSSSHANLTLYGYSGSTTEAYATKNGLRFQSLNNPERVIIDSGKCGDCLTWVLYDDGELVIDGTGDMWNYTSKKDAPWLAYTNRVNITTLTIEEGVTSIGDYAFYTLYKLTSVSIPEGVTSIGNTAFGFCLVLPELTLPSTVETVGQGAIRACRELTSFTFPAGVTEISTYVLADCFKLESIFVDEANPFYCTESGVLFDKNKTTLIQYPAGKKM